MISNGLDEAPGLKNDCQAEIVSDVWRVWETNVSRVDDDDWGRTRELLVKGRRVGSSYSFMAQGVDENSALMSLSGSSSKRRCGSEVVMTIALYC